MFWTDKTNPASELRHFGLLVGGFFPLLFGLALPYLHHHPLPLWPWVVMALLWIPALLFPVLLDPIYAIWTRIGTVLGWINTRIILGLVYCLMIVPIGLLMQWTGKAKIRNIPPKQVESYRHVEQQRPINTFKRMF
jgi:hypothetical protein